jgi:predicted  nucleic acid-binding Zn-ribbon protein
MSEQNKLSVGQSLIGLGIVLGGGWALSNLDTVTGALGEVVSVALDKFDFVAWNRANNVAAFDEYVINEVQRLGGMSNTNAGRFYDSFNFTDEEKTRLFFKFYPSLICGKCGNEYNTLFFSSCPKCRERRRKLSNAGISGSNALVGTAGILRGRGRASRQSSRAASGQSFSQVADDVKRGNMEAKMPAHTSPKSVDEQLREFIAELHRSNPKMSESEIKAILKPLIASEFKKPEAEPKKAKKTSKSVTSIQVRERIYDAWCELKSSLGERKRVTQEEWKGLVRAEFPDADSVLIRKVQSEVHEYNRLKG